MIRRYAPPDEAVRVLIVYQHLPHYRYEVFRALEDDPRLDVTFAAGRASGNGSIRVIPFSQLKRVIPMRNVELGPWLWQRGLVATVWREDVDAVVFLGDIHYLSTWFGAALCRLKGTAVLYWTIGWHKPDGARLARWARLAFYRLAHHLLVYGDWGRRLGVEAGYPEERMTVVYNSASEQYDALAETDREANHFGARLPKRGVPVATAVLRLMPEKRLPLLIEAAAAVRERGVPLEVLLVGEGPERERLQAMAETAKVPLHLPGAVYGRQALEAVYERTTVTVIPARAGLTVVQSMKYGRPVITHDNPFDQVPEFEAIVAGVTGDLYTFGSVESLATCILRWVRIQERESETTARRCREEVSARWTPRVQAARISEQIGRLAGRR